MYLNGTIRRYLDDASAGVPTPGGGSVAALSGALAMSMGCMAANFTVGKKKFKEVEPEVRTLLSQCEKFREELLVLMDEDTRAYAAVSAAYAMPKESPEQKTARTAAIQQALSVAMDAPQRVVRACRLALRSLARLIEVANPNLISDVGVAAILAEAALRAARLNVEINLSGLADAAKVAAARAELSEAASEAAECSRLILEKVNRSIGGGS